MSAPDLTELPFGDTADFEAVERGLIDRGDPVVRDDKGAVVWDNGSYSFLAGEAPDTVHPSLWRQSTLVARQGLFEVTDGIYQVRGYDLSNMSIIEGDTGIIVIDPLISAETAAAALALYRKHRGDRPVVAVIHTHSHIDHFGGVKGIVSQDDVDAGRVQIIAPEGFVEHAISENVYAGTAMGRRAGYMYGAALPRGPKGAVGAGLGQTTSSGTVTLIAPTVTITTTGQELTVDGVRTVFQMAPGTEAPAEMHFYFPDRRALCMAENATHTLHNLLTLRGALVRDPHVWAHYLTEAIELFAGQSDVVFASHHWPTWGTENITEFLTIQRDLYAYLHDQTLRLLNQGYTGPEIAEMIELPPALERAWHTHGYYGSVSHDVKAIYQRYMGWYDGNPARLWPHPPQERATRYVEFMGGADEVVAKARHSVEAGDLRWAAEVLDHVVFADPGHAEARQLLADVFEQLGYGSENGTWRCEFLSAAMELRTGNFGTPTAPASADIVSHLSPEMLFDALAIQVNGPKAWDLDLAIRWDLPDHGASYRTTLHNGVLTYVKDSAKPASLTLTVPAAALSALAQGDVAAARRGGLTMNGDQSQLASLFSVLQAGDPDFNIIEP
ncbi:MAG TPA: alkyl sulfatase dimerization domain-containing protein [Streptosporangiaceae bacterium]|nr:alkyl sulfatase dimerization domain-containing protein [Streptosporangiaceae bacterium]